jgi:Putative Ig domain/Fibronectin type III domain
VPGRIRTAALLAALAAVAIASSSAAQTPGQGGPPGGSPPGLAVAIAVQERHADRLLDTPGIVGTGVGLNPAGRPVIRVYTERPDVANVPAALEGVGVERVTTGILEARAPTDRFPRPVPIGVSAGHLDTATGTLGVRVTNGAQVFALSNNHVFAAIDTASIGDGIIQPGNVDGGSDPADRIGTLHDFQTIDFSGGNNIMDAAIALTSPTLVGTDTPADGYGSPSNVTTAAFVGQQVQKYGRTTGLQLGTVAEINVQVDVCYLLIFEFCLQEAHFVDQVSVTPDAFSAAGDSGSLIVTQGGNQPVALLFAGGEGRTIGSPIDPILQRFGVTIDGAPPGDGPPGAPTGLTALAGDGSVSLSWTAPSFDGGSSLTGYRIHRGTSPGGETFLESVGTGTSFTDATAANGTTYYYKVSAENALGEGPRSNEAQATPAALVPPSAPLQILDDFNRPNETLSDAGGWSNGVIGSVETGLNVVSNQLACSKTTTCTAWRANAPYGPDVEVSARFATLAGVNNQLRLYVRLTQPPGAVDGYMLRTNEQSGTDEVWLERMDDGSAARLLTISQELQPGDLVLLRAKGSTIEAWLQRGSSWSRLGTVHDATYAAAGYVGVGLRGTTGRLDDFGGRTMGAPPPAPTITTTTMPDATNTQPYSRTLSATGGTPPYTQWTVVAGNLPTGLALSNAGVVSGTPNAAAGSYSFTVEVTDSASQTDTQALTIAVADPLSITTASLPGGTVGQAYSQALAASGGKTPYTWSLAAGSLPAGLTLNASTGAITGTPTSAGTSNFTVQATDSGNPARTDTQSLSIVVAPATTLTITTVSLPEGSVGIAYTATLAVSGGVAPYTWALVSGGLPPGVNLAAGTGALAGTPTKQGRYTFTVRVTDALGAQASKTFSIRVRR